MDRTAYTGYDPSESWHCHAGTRGCRWQRNAIGADKLRIGRAAEKQVSADNLIGGGLHLEVFFLLHEDDQLQASDLQDLVGSDGGEDLRILLEKHN